MPKTGKDLDITTHPELAITPDRPVVVEDDADYSDVQALMRQYGAITFPGADLTQKLDMLGVPFVIVGIRFQQAMKMRSDNGTERWRDYVTLDCYVADSGTIEDQIRRGRVLKAPGKNPETYNSIADMRVTPEARIVINDGSTGVRRDVVKLLDAWGLVEVGHYEDDGDRRYDRAWTEWDNAFPNPRNAWTSADGTQVPTFRSMVDGRPLVLVCNRGLHGSVYPNEYAPSGWATTFYVS